MKQAVDRFADFGLKFGNRDFVLYAKAYGASSHRIETIESFIPILDDAFRSGARDPDRLFRERAGSGRRAAGARDREGVVGWQIENNHRQLAVP
jgi:hypothetical protein